MLMRHSLITAARKGIGMHIFVTGATGHIGSALVPELVAAGHEVTGLARSDASASALERLGARVHRGSLEDLDGLRVAASEADGVVHLAFRHDAMRSGDFAGAVATDFAAIQALGETLEGTGKAFVGSSGALIVAGKGRVGTEEDTSPSGPRVDAENYEIALADCGVRSSVVRLSPITHSAELDRHGFATVLIATARRTGVSAYIDDGENRWPAAHTLDTAHLFRLAVENAPAGSRLHAVSEEGVTTKAIATTIGEHLGLPIVSISREAATGHFGFLAGLFQVDAPTSNAITRRLVGWQPSEVGLLTDLQDDRYYNRA
jgi:nucleoside-diphosphate-sugar epimerase